MSHPLFSGTPPSFAELYENTLVPTLFRPCAERLLGRLQIKPGERLLDVATGTGIVARMAKERVGSAGVVVGVDLSPVMLGGARSIAPAIDWREGNAAALPVTDGETFDVVTCQQGLQFLPDRPAAAREFLRVLAPGGRVGIATWVPIEESPVFRESHATAERLLGPITDQRHAFGDTDALARLLTEAGFQDFRVDRITIPVRFEDPAVFARMNAMALVGMSAPGKTMTDEQKAETAGRIGAETLPLLAGYRDGGRLSFELGSTVGIATKPR